MTPAEAHNFFQSFPKDYVAWQKVRDAYTRERMSEAIKALEESNGVTEFGLLTDVLDRLHEHVIGPSLLTYVRNAYRALVVRQFVGEVATNKESVAVSAYDVRDHLDALHFDDDTEEETKAKRFPAIFGVTQIDLEDAADDINNHIGVHAVRLNAIYMKKRLEEKIQVNPNAPTSGTNGKI